MSCALVACPQVLLNVVFDHLHRDDVHGLIEAGHKGHERYLTYLRTACRRYECSVLTLRHQRLLEHTTRLQRLQYKAPPRSAALTCNRLVRNNAVTLESLDIPLETDLSVLRLCTRLRATR